MERILATYRITAPEAESRTRAEELAIEQSVEMPLNPIDDRRILDEIVAKVIDVRLHGDFFEVDLGIAPETTGNEPAQLMNMLFGNCSMQPEVELIDVRFPAGYERAVSGPPLGLVGIRAPPRAPAR